jgi:hypothetical protein
MTDVIEKKFITVRQNILKRAINDFQSSDKKEALTYSLRKSIALYSSLNLIGVDHDLANEYCQRTFEQYKWLTSILLLLPIKALYTFKMKQNASTAVGGILYAGMGVSLGFFLFHYYKNVKIEDKLSSINPDFYTTNRTKVREHIASKNQK